MDKIELCKRAIAASEVAYSPYSGCKVGAALLTEAGSVFVGCNIENASFSATVCAERTAIFSAVAAGERKFKAIAVAGSIDEKISEAFLPCGICRQVMSEFCDESFPVLVATGEDSFKEYTLSQLLPQAFTFKHKQ